MKGTLIYVVSYCPGRCGAGGGFDWFIDPQDAISMLGNHTDHDENLEFDYILRSVYLPTNIDVKDRIAVTRWLDSDGYHLWNTVQQDETV